MLHGASLSFLIFTATVGFQDLIDASDNCSTVEPIQSKGCLIQRGRAETTALQTTRISVRQDPEATPDTIMGYIAQPLDCGSQHDVFVFTDRNYSLWECRQQCAHDHECPAFSYDFTWNRCVIKAISCVPNADRYTGWTLYAREAFPIPSVVGYIQSPDLDCDGEEYFEYVPLRTYSLDECKLNCDGDPACAAFSYDFCWKRCLTKKASCIPNRYNNTGWAAYVKAMYATSVAGDGVRKDGPNCHPTCYGNCIRNRNCN